MKDNYLSVNYYFDPPMKDKYMNNNRFGVAAELTPPHSRVMETFGERIDRLIKVRMQQGDRDASHRALARFVGLSQPTVSDIINGDSAPKPEFTEAAARFFGLEGSDLSEFLDLGRFAWLASNKEKGRYVWQLREKVERLQSNLEDAIFLIDTMVMFYSQKGHHLPREFTEKLATLKKRRETLK